MADITINGISVDPQLPATAGMARARDLDLADTRNTNYILVQTRGVLGNADRQQLETLGVQIVEYVPENTYLAKYKPSDLEPVIALDCVEWAGPYLPGFKVASSLSPHHATRLALAVAAAPTERVLNDASKEVDVVLHRDADPAEVVGKIASAAGLDSDDLQPAGGKVRLRLPLNRLADVAALDEVRHIEEVFPSKLHNDVARRVLGLDATGGHALPYVASGQVVAVCDTGFDKGSTSNVHPAFAHRVRKLYALGRASKANDPNGHGTHVAGSVLADGHSTALGRIQGTAPKAELVLQSVLDAGGGLGGLPADLRNLFAEPYEHDGARVHTNSWGSTLGDGRYDSQCFELDDFVWNHRDLVICFAAGNAGRDANADGIVEPMSVTPPGTAKNCITIGACENDRPEIAEVYGSWWPSTFPSNPIAPDRMANNPQGMVGFSSRGPTRDKRFKPDVVAPGTFILSAKSRDVAASNNAWRASADPLYYFMGGTSVATPLVAGCAALVREFLATRPTGAIVDPSAALVKALLINGAVDIPGQYLPSETGTIPNSNEGFGRVNMEATVGAGSTQLVVIQDEGDALEQDDTTTFSVSIAANQSTLKATLVWTDPPGESLQNDLDLIVKAGAEERHGNMAIGSTDFDRVNNVEQVVWAGLSTSEVKVVVRAHRITQSPQSFALVIRVG
jgi:subtilisin family serine protease